MDISVAMWMQLRAWWYLRFSPTIPLDDKGATGTRMPPDVREYIIRRSIQPAIDKAKTDEAKKKLSGLFWDQAVSGLISPGLSDELIAAAFRVLDNVPYTIRYRSLRRCRNGFRNPSLGVLPPLVQNAAAWSFSWMCPMEDFVVATRAAISTKQVADSCSVNLKYVMITSDEA